jgi:hypothetical protein
MLYTQGLPFSPQNRLYGRRLSSLPRTPIAGPLFNNAQAAKAVLDAAITKTGRDSRLQLQIKTQSTELDGMIEGLVCTPWRLSYILPLPGDGERVFRIADRSRRSSIQGSLNKAQRHGVYSRIAETEEDLKAWFRLYLANMRRNVVPPRSYRFFSILWSLLRPRGLMQLVVAEQETSKGRQTIAGTIYLMYARTVSAAFTGASESELALRPNDVTHWHAINDATKKGFTAFDFGEVPAGKDDLAWFKLKWGSLPTRLYRYYYPATPEIERDIVHSGRYVPGPAELVWRYLPLDATARLGDLIYRYL